MAFLQSLHQSSLDVATGLELREAEWVALVYNSDLRVARADRAVAEAVAAHAGLWDDPEISLDLLHALSSVPDPWIIGSAVSITIPLSGRLERAKKLALAELDVALLRVLEQERSVLRQLRERWLEWSVLHHRIALTDELLADLESITATASRLAELGEMLRSESSLFEIERTSREIDRDVLIAQQQVVGEEIRSLMGLSPHAPLQPVPHVSFRGSEQDFDTGSPRVLEHTNPELARMKSAYTAAEERLHLEVRKQYPDLTIGPQYESESGQSRIGFIGSIPLPILNANRQGIAEAEAARERARAEFETAYERLIGRMAALRRVINAARTEQEQITLRLAPLVDQQVHDAQQLLAIGEGRPLVLLEGIVRRHEAKLRSLEATATEGNATIELIQLSGEVAVELVDSSTSPRQEKRQ